jgi:hypothetical protein
LIAWSRAGARRFRAVMRLALREQGPRGAEPWVLCRAGPDGLNVQAGAGSVAVRCHHAGARPAEALAFRASVLAAFAGHQDDPVELEQIACGKGQARWSEGSEPRVLDLETVVPDRLPAFPRLPKQFTPMPAAFLGALAEAAKTTARESVRFALARLQLRGKTGEIVATDGRQLLVQGGFPFPWADHILIPRVPAFGPAVSPHATVVVLINVPLS